MRNMINRTHIEGYVYEHKLEKRVSGENSKNPGTEFIMGTLSIATDEECLNIVPVHFTYVTATTAKGNANATYGVLKNIIDGVIGNVMDNGKENAGKVRIDSAIGLNEFYSDRNGTEELVSAKRNEGGFVHTVDVLTPEEKARNTFEVDMLITNVRTVEADEERGYAAKVVVRGCIFDFRKAVLPVEFSVTNERGMAYFEGSFYLTADDGTADEKEPDHLYRVDISPGASNAPVVLERTFDDVTFQGEIEGLTFDKKKRQFLLHYNRGSRIVLGMVKGFYPGYDKEISEVFVYDITN